MYVVNGYTFETQEMAEKAKREANGIKYIRSQTKMDDPEVVFKLYHKLIDRKYFETPVGLAFMEELHDYLQSIPFFRAEDIRPLPQIQTKEELLESLKQDVRQKHVESRRTEQKAQSIAVPKKEREKAQKVVAQNKKMQKARERAIDSEIAKNERKYKRPFMISSFLAIVFGLVIIGMFIIMNISGNSVTIVNYENEIINKYEDWEKDLKEREAVIMQREAELGIER